MDQSEDEGRGLGTAFVVSAPHAIQTARAGPFCSTSQYADTSPADFALLPGRGVRGYVDQRPSNRGPHSYAPGGQSNGGNIGVGFGTSWRCSCQAQSERTQAGLRRSGATGKGIAADPPDVGYLPAGCQPQIRGEFTSAGWYGSHSMNHDDLTWILQITGISLHPRS
jgi:hypothetical protein